MRIPLSSGGELELSEALNYFDTIALKVMHCIEELHTVKRVACTGFYKKKMTRRHDVMAVTRLISEFSF